MSITITTDLDEVASKATTLYYAQKVAFEAADEIERTVAPLWNRLPDGTRLIDVTRRTRHGNLYMRQWGQSSSSSWFTATASLADFLKDGYWPDFDYDDESKQDVIMLWTELIGASEEAANVARIIRETGEELNTLMLTAEQGHDAQDMRGWYARVSTGRRDVTGWIVAGRGGTLHILPDPMAGAIRIKPNILYHVPPLSDQRVANVAVATPTTDLDAEVPIKFSLKSSTIYLLLPPDMAEERKEWVRRILTIKVSCREEAVRLWEEFLQWKREAHIPLQKQATFNDWRRKLPKEFGENWTKQLRWSPGAKEAFAVLRRLAGISDEDLLKAVQEEFFRNNPENVLTKEEKDILAKRPKHGSDHSETTHAALICSKNTGLAPLF